MAPSTPGAASRWSRWMPHPSARRQWPQVDHGSIRRGLLAHGSLWGGATSHLRTLFMQSLLTSLTASTADMAAQLTHDAATDAVNDEDPERDRATQV